jgi:two-component system, CitB family, response regulator DctR
MQPITTLVIDDSEPFRALLRKRLEALGCWIVGEAGSATEGLQLFRSSHPRLVTLDLMMPDEPGFLAKDLFHIIRKEAPDTLIVVISVGSRVPTASPFLSEGATGYLEKTCINFEQLRQILVRMFPELESRAHRHL